MIKRKQIIKIAIDSPAAAGAGTLAKAISKQPRKTITVISHPPDFGNELT